MMRYERVSPEECVALSNVKKSNLKTTCSKQQDGSGENGRIPIYNNGSSSSFEAKGSSRFRSPSKSQDHNHHQSSHVGGNGGGYNPTSSPQLENNHDTTRSHNNSPSPNHGSGDVLLQWGQKKRSRASRTITDDSSSSSSAPSAQARQQAPKIQRRRLSLTQSLPSPCLPVDKLSNTAQTGSMPPPPPPPPPSAAAAAAASNGRRNRSSSTTKESSSSGGFRNLEERSGTGNGVGRVVSRSTTSTVVGKRSSPSPSPEKVDRKKIPSSGWSAKDEKPNESCIDSAQEAGAGAVANTNNSNTPAAIAIGGGGEKGIVQVLEWPRIYINLSRKEKEEDFLAMKGTKLPHRPKKRPKNVDRSLQYCFPGMWLSDLTRSRYEVREKKCAKKQKRRGLKGMESMDSDSD